MANHSIVVVGHEKAIRDLVSKLLQDDGYKVHGTGDSGEAIELARRIKPALLVIDPIMPGLSGVEAARRISRETKCKVLFLSSLAKDADFREMLRGLKRQGCECGALDLPFQPNELLSCVRREIGTVVILTDAEEPTGTTVPSEAPPVVSKPAPARTALADYQPLLEMAVPQVYARNAFRVTGLRVDASLRDISRQGEKLEMMAKLGVNTNAQGILSGKSATTEEIRGALQSLKIPEQRLLHEFFWFWPTHGNSDNDPALAAIDIGDLGKAEEVWRSWGIGQHELTSVSARLDGRCSDAERTSLVKKKKQLEQAAAVSIHNLAVLFHLRALTPEPAERSRSADEPSKRIRHWATSLKFWSQLQKRHGFWEVLVGRVREFDDPRLGIEVGESIWNTLPLAVLSVNAQLAVAATEGKNFEEASMHRRLMNEAGFGTGHVRDSLCRALKPLQEELARLCRAAESDALREPEKAADIVRKLFEEKKKYLQAFNYLLGAGDPLRDSVNDLVAQAARTSLVAYANKTENWEIAQPLFEECLALAESKSLRSRLEDDLEMLAGNAAAQRAARRTQATAATRPPESSQQNPQQAPPASATRADGQRRPAPVSNQRPVKRRWFKPVIAVVAVFAVAIFIGFALVGSDDATSSSSGASYENRRTTATPNTTSSNAYRNSYSTDNSYANTTSTSPNTTTWSDTSADSSLSDTQDIQNLRSAIERNRETLRQMESALSDLDSRITALNSQMVSDKASLQRMTRDHDMGYDVDIDLYEATRQRHNSAVATYNNLVNEYNTSHAVYKSLLSSTNEQIDRYNALVRSR